MLGVKPLTLNPCPLCQDFDDWGLGGLYSRGVGKGANFYPHAFSCFKIEHRDRGTRNREAKASIGSIN